MNDFNFKLYLDYFLYVQRTDLVSLIKACNAQNNTNYTEIEFKNEIKNYTISFEKIQNLLKPLNYDIAIIKYNYPKNEYTYKELKSFKEFIKEQKINLKDLINAFNYRNIEPQYNYNCIDCKLRNDKLAYFEIANLLSVLNFELAFMNRDNKHIFELSEILTVPLHNY